MLGTGQIKKLTKFPDLMEQAFYGYLNAEGLKLTQEKTFGTIDLYNKKVLTSTTNSEYFGGQATAANSNMNSFIRQEGEHMLITKIRFLSSTGLALNAGNWSPIVGSDDEIINGEFTLVVDNVTQLQRIPLSETIHGTDSGKYGVFELIKPIFWAAQTKLSLQLALKNAPGGANTNLQVELHGVGLS